MFGVQKKILHILVLPQLAGSQRVALDILRSLPDDEFEKHVLFSTEIDGIKRQECQQAFEGAGVKVHYSKNLKRSICLSDLPALFEIYRMCRRNRYDIVHTHSTKPGIIGRIAATLAQVPCVIHTVHGLAFHKFVKFPRWQFYWLCEMVASLFCDRIVLVNKYYLRYFKWFRKKTTTIYNGVVFSLSPPIVPISDRINREPLKILSVGRVDFQKDPLTLLKAAQIVIRKEPKVQFTIVGEGELYQDCVQFIAMHGLSANITMAGWHNDVQLFYMNHDIFALTSIYESFGLIFVEAGYHMLPVVATNVEGIPEVVLDGETGLLAEAKNVERIADNILHLMADSRMRTEMGIKAHDWVISHFSTEEMCRKYLDLYRACCVRS